MSAKTPSRVKSRNATVTARARPSVFDGPRARPSILLPALVLLAAAIRFALSMITSNGATVFIDESLYVNIARALFEKGEVLYRGQPIDYVYLIYPIALLPVYLLPAGVNLYRAVQLWNALLMATAVLPVYYIGRGMRLSRTRSYGVAVIAALLPEMCLSSYLVVECIVYPLMLWIAYLALRMFQGKAQSRDCAILGAMTAIAYFVKPVCAIFGVCALLVHLCNTLRRKERNGWIWPAMGLLIATGLTGAGYMAYRTFFGQATLLNLYEKQSPTFDASNLYIMFKGAVFHLFAVAIYFGGAIALLPALARKRFEGPQRLMANALLTAIAASIVGIAIWVVPFNYTGSFGFCPAHTRYLGYYMPVLFAFLLAPEMDGWKPGRFAYGALIAVSALFVFPGGYSVFSSQAGTFDSPALNLFCADKIGNVPGILAICAVVPAMLCLLWEIKKRGFTARARRICCWTATLFLLANGTAVYANRKPITQQIESESQWIATDLADSDYVVISNNHYNDIRGFQLDCHVHGTPQVVVCNDAFYSALEEGGVYVPFTPVLQAPNIENRPLIDTDTLLFDITVADYVEFAEGVETYQSPEGLYTVARIQPGKPYLKTALAGMNGYLLNAGAAGRLLIYDESLRNAGEITLTIRLRSISGTPGTLTLQTNASEETLPLTGEIQTLSVTLPTAQDGLYALHCDVDTVVFEYSTR